MNTIDPSLKAYLDSLTAKVNDSSFSSFERWYIFLITAQTFILILYAIETYRLRKSAVNQTTIVQQQLDAMRAQNETLTKQLALNVNQLTFQQMESERHEEAAKQLEDRRQREREQEAEPVFSFQKVNHGNGVLGMVVQEIKKTGTILDCRASIAGVSKHSVDRNNDPYKFLLNIPATGGGAVTYIGIQYKTHLDSRIERVYAINMNDATYRGETTLTFGGLGYATINH